MYKNDEVSVLMRDKFMVNEDGFTITFTGWKRMAWRKTLIFPYIKGTEKEASQAIKHYLKARPTFAKQDEKALFIDDQGKALDRHTTDKLWHHLLDHSSYKGLNKPLHSMRIGGSRLGTVPGWK